MSHFDLPPGVPQRERPANYASVLAAFQKQRPLERLVLLELVEMAKGGNPPGGDPRLNTKGLREDYYPEWSNEDFRALLEDLGHSMPDDR